MDLYITRTHVHTHDGTQVEAECKDARKKADRLEKANAELMDKMAKQQIQTWDKLEDQLFESQQSIVQQLIDARLKHAEVYLFVLVFWGLFRMYC